MSASFSFLGLSHMERGGRWGMVRRKEVRARLNCCAFNNRAGIWGWNNRGEKRKRRVEWPDGSTKGLLTRVRLNIYVLWCKLPWPLQTHREEGDTEQPWESPAFTAKGGQDQGVCKNLGMGATGTEAPVLELPTLWILAVLDNPSPYHKATWSWVSSNLQPKAPSWHPPFWNPQLSVHASRWHSFPCMGTPAVCRHGPYSEFLPLLLHFPGMPFPKILTHPVFPCPPVFSSNATFSKRPSWRTHYGLIPGIYSITLLWVLCVAHHYWGCVCCFSCLSFPTEVSVPLGIFRSVSLLYPQHPIRND